MCFLCEKSFDESLPHIETEIKKLKRKKLLEKARDAKKLLQCWEKFLKDAVSTDEEEMIKRSILSYKNILYAIGRVM